MKDDTTDNIPTENGRQYTNDYVNRKYNMKLVTRNNLENWAGTTFSKATLPYLISRLVRATYSPLKQ